MSLNGQADALAAFNFDDVRTAPAAAARGHRHATYRTFDGQVLRVRRAQGRRQGLRHGRRAPRRRAGREVSRTRARAPAAPRSARGSPAPATPRRSHAAKAADQTAETLGARAKGLEFEIPRVQVRGDLPQAGRLLEPKPAKAAKK